MDEFILSQQDLRAAMRFGDYVEAVADGFRLLAEGRCASPVPTQIDVAHGVARAARQARWLEVKGDANLLRVASVNSLGHRLFRLLVAGCKNRHSRVKKFVYVYRFNDTPKSSARLSRRLG